MKYLIVLVPVIVAAIAMRASSALQHLDNVLTELTKQEIATLLDRHNEYRRKVEPSGRNIRLLSWDDKLAGRAQAYSSKCRFLHSAKTLMEPFGYIGENIYITSQQTLGVDDVARSVTSWFNEKNFYDFDSNSCARTKVCGHYTQTVWDDTYKVGCGKTKCNQTVEVRNKTYLNPIMIVCNYGPSGNVKPLFTSKARRPYKKGDWCSACPDDAPICVDRLCDQWTQDDDEESTIKQPPRSTNELQKLEPFTGTANAQKQPGILPVKKSIRKFVPPNLGLRCFTCTGELSTEACVSLNQTKQCETPKITQVNILPREDSSWSCGRYKRANLVRMKCLPTSECRSLKDNVDAICCEKDLCNNARKAEFDWLFPLLELILLQLSEVFS